MQTKQEKLREEIMFLQMIWTMGAIERLAHLLVALTRNILKEDGASEQIA